MPPVLSHLCVFSQSHEFKETAVNAIGELLRLENIGERIEEIKAIINRLDFRWHMGFIQEDDYIQQREELKAEFAQLQPIPRDELVPCLKSNPTVQCGIVGSLSLSLQARSRDETIQIRNLSDRSGKTGTA